MMNARRAQGGDRGAGTAEYAALAVLAALILSALVVAGIPGTIASGVDGQICQIFGEGDCAKPKRTTAAGDTRDPSTPPTPSGPNTPGGQSQTKPQDPLQVRAVSAKGPQPNPEPNRPPPPNPNAPDWGPSTGHGPGNRGIGKSGDLPRGGDHPYVPPKSGRGKPVKVPKDTAWKDNKGRTWKWDRLHKDHWDVTDKDGDHINVNPDGSEARKPKAEPTPSATGQQNDGKQKGGGKAKSVLPWGIGLGGAGALWWGGKILSPACGPLAPACAVAL